MESIQVLLLVVVAALTLGAAVPPLSKGSLSIKDKLALDLPIKQVHDKTQGKTEVAKVGFPSTTTTTTTTQQPHRNHPARPTYVDATVFRHQFTTQVPSSTTTTTTTTTEASDHDYEGYFRLWDDLSSFAGELGPLGRDLRGDEYIGGFRPLGF
ncbi:uncharacterized protein [Cherax quadricarinatus]